MITPREYLEETRALVAGLNYGPFHFTSNHASNYLPLKGTLPDDREKFLSMIDNAWGEAADSQRIFPRPLTPAKKSKTHGGFCPPWVLLCQKENNMRYVGTIETGKGGCCLCTIG